MTKYLKSIFLSLVIISFSSVDVLAHSGHVHEGEEIVLVEDNSENETQEISDPALQLSFERGKQNYPDKSFNVILKIDSDITSGRVSVIWSYPRGYLQIQGESEQIVTVTAGQTTEISKTFIPVPGAEQLLPGKNKTVEIVARVNAFVANQNYLSTSSLSMTLTDDLVFIPPDSDYQTKKIVSTTLYWVVGIVSFVLINFAIIVGVRKFKAYLNSDDEK